MTDGIACAVCVAFNEEFGGEIRPATTTRRAEFTIDAGFGGWAMFSSDGEVDIPLCETDADEVDSVIALDG